MNSRWARGLSRMASATRRRPRQASKVVRCAAGEGFDAWLSINPLPARSRPISQASALATEQPTPVSTHRPSARFSWQRTPHAAAHCLHQQGLQWSVRGGTHLLGSDQAGRVQLRLQLPRVVAGLFPVLIEVLQPWESPLPRPASAEHDAVLRVLHSLAQHADHDADHDGVPQLRLLGGENLGKDVSSSRTSAAGSVQTLSEGSQGLTSSQSRLQASKPLQQTTAAAPDIADGSRVAGGLVLQATPCPAQFSICSQLLVLLSADSAALAIIAEGVVVKHKVLTGYTVRRKQGKAQMTYERQGGGAHSAGGSIRAREARRLFQAAAATLHDWGHLIAGCNQLYRGGTVRPWNELYAARSPPVAVERGDPRWREVGVGVRRPRLRDLQRVASALLHGSLEELS